MPIPRYIDNKGVFEIIMFCRACGWAIPKDIVSTNTPRFKRCDHCGGELVTMRNDYPRSARREK